MGSARMRRWKEGRREGKKGGEQASTAKGRRTRAKRRREEWSKDKECGENRVIGFALECCRERMELAANTVCA